MVPNWARWWVKRRTITACAYHRFRMLTLLGCSQKVAMENNASEDFSKWTHGEVWWRLHISALACMQQIDKLAVREPIHSAESIFSNPALKVSVWNESFIDSTWYLPSRTRLLSSSFDEPMWIDIFLPLCCRHRLLAWASAIFYFMWV